jgi:hypothetical protein
MPTISVLGGRGRKISVQDQLELYNETCPEKKKKKERNNKKRKMLKV